MHTMSLSHGVHQGHFHGLHPLGWLVQAMATRRERVHLEDLDDHMLADIGLDRRAAKREAQRPFWDLR